VFDEMNHYQVFDENVVCHFLDVDFDFEVVFQVMVMSLFRTI
jgi:hypothetical protein